MIRLFSRQIKAGIFSPPSLTSDSVSQDSIDLVAVAESHEQRTCSPALFRGVPLVPLCDVRPSLGPAAVSRTDPDSPSSLTAGADRETTSLGDSPGGPDVT